MILQVTMDTKNLDIDKNSRFEKAIADFHKEYDTAQLSRFAEKFESLVKDTLENSNFEKIKISSRVKETNSCLEKFERKYREEWEEDGSNPPISSYLTDLIGLRVTCLYSDNVRPIANLLKNAFECDETQGETDKTSSTQSDEAKFGYLGVHLDLEIGPKLSSMRSHAHLANIPFEVQIRSISQDAWSEVDHGLKYKKDNLPLNIKRRVNRLAAVFELADQEFVAIRQDIEKAEKDLNELTIAEDEVLNAINLNHVVKQIFSAKPLSSFHNSSILAAVDMYRPNLLASDFKDIVENQLEDVNSYIESFADKDWKAATVLRHCLYKHDNTAFKFMLKRWQRQKYDEWTDNHLAF